MHDETELNHIGRAIREAGPEEASEAAVEGVLTEARAKAAGVRQPGRRTTALRLVAAAAAVVVVSAFAVVAASQLNSRTAFAKERALAAITPKAGYVIHAKTTTWAKNEGEANPIEDGSQVSEFWLDLAGDRERIVTHAVDGSVLSLFVSDGKRERVVGVNPIYPTLGRSISEADSEGAGSATLFAYEYVRSSMPEGQRVGTVMVRGEPYWDVRWTNAKDSGGLRLAAHAQFRKSDYAPALIERSYPGGGTERWTVLQWDVVPTSQLPTDTFSLTAIPSAAGVPEEFAWKTADLHKHVDYSVYWSGERVGRTAIAGLFPDPPPNDNSVPYFIQQLGFPTVPNRLLGGSATLAEYTGDKVATVTVNSGRPTTRAALSGALAKAAARGSESGECTSAVGVGELVTLPDGSALAGFALPDATVFVQTTDRVALRRALGALRRVR